MVLARLGLRKLAQKPREKKCFDYAVNGKQAQTLIAEFATALADLTPEQLDAAHARCNFGPKSKLVNAIAKCIRKVCGGENTDGYQRFRQHLDVLKHFAIAFRSALKMRPTEDDYQLVEVHMRRYIILKVKCWPCCLNWYDWHNYNAVPRMMRKFGSMRLLSAEAIEGWQKQLNELIQKSNHNANCGRIPDIIHEAGPDFVDTYREQTAQRMKSQERWVYDQALNRSYSNVKEVLARAEQLAENSWLLDEPGCISWMRRFAPSAPLPSKQEIEKASHFPLFSQLWKRFMVGTHFTCRLVSLFRRKRAAGVGLFVRLDLERVRTTNADKFYEALCKSYRAYYEAAPTPKAEKHLSKQQWRRHKKQRRLARDKRRSAFRSSGGNALVSMLPTDYNPPPAAAAAAAAVG
jgi:hypothetical protein